MKVLSILLLTYLFISCNEPLIVIGNKNAGNSSIKGNGKIISKNIEVNRFDIIDNSFIADIHFVQDSSFSVSLSVDENLVSYFNIKEINTKLIIDENGRENIQPTQAIVEIHIPYLKTLNNLGTGNFKAAAYNTQQNFYINNTGTGDIHIHQINVNMLDILNSGTGDILLEGFANELKLKNTGTGDFNCKSLITNISTVINTGTGNVSLQVNETADFNNTGTGDIFYNGKAKNTTINNTGTGKVKKM